MIAPDNAAEEPPLSAPRLSVVVVTYNSAAQIAESVPAIAAELRPGDELIICDNASTDGTVERLGLLAPDALLIETGANLGFAAACNRGAEAARNELLLLLNPDAVVEPGFRDAIELPLTEAGHVASAGTDDPDRRGWAAWQGLVSADGGSTVNTWGGVVHFTAIAWAGGAGSPIAAAPAEPGEVGFPSGACLAIRREVWTQLGGFSEEYFLYHEDTDLGLRLRLAGHRCGIEPRARVAHDYEFEKGAHKWLHLEQNRWATIIRVYPRRVLWATLPALLATEPALFLAAAVGGWLPEKLRSYGGVARSLPRLLRERRRIQAGAAITPGRFSEALVAELDSEFLGAASRSGILRALLRGYWRLARKLIGS